MEDFGQEYRDLERDKKETLDTYNKISNKLRKIREKQDHIKKVFYENRHNSMNRKYTTRELLDSKDICNDVEINGFKINQRYELLKSLEGIIRFCNYGRGQYIPVIGLYRDNVESVKSARLSLESISDSLRPEDNGCFLIEVKVNNKEFGGFTYDPSDLDDSIYIETDFKDLFRISDGDFDGKEFSSLGEILDFIAKEQWFDER